MMWRHTVILMLTFVGANALMCWKCTDEESNEACIENGTIEQCQESQAACQNEIRTVQGKLKIDKRCKQKEACENNEKQNGGMPGFTPLQCSMEPTGSVCRCCCYTNECNEDLLFCKAAKKLVIYEVEYEGSGLYK